MKVSDIKENLINQLLKQGKNENYLEDMVEDYCCFFKLKNDLIKDIKENGIRIKSTTGNGFEVTKPNESILNLIKVNTQMLKILNDLKLQEPIETENDDDGYL